MLKYTSKSYSLCRTTKKGTRNLSTNNQKIFHSCAEIFFVECFFLDNNKKQINNTIQEEKDKLQNLIDVQRKIDVLPNSEKKQTLDARLMLTKEEVKKHLTELKTDLDDNKGDLQSYFENAKVVTQKERFNDVSISIGRDKFRSIRKYGPTKISIKEYKLLAEPYKK